MPLPVVWLVDLAIAIVYGLVIAFGVVRFRKGWGILVGGLIGCVLYLLNFVVISGLFPAWRGNEPSVLFTHIVFGLLAAGGYRGRSGGSEMLPWFSRFPHRKTPSDGPKCCRYTG